MLFGQKGKIFKPVGTLIIMAITLTTVQAVKDKATSSANATILANAGSEIDRYIEAAEGVIVGITKIDWITNFSSITASVKVLLSECVSALAANQIISYDMTGFSPMNSAVTTLNVNNKLYQSALKELKDLDTNKLRSVPT